MPATHWEKLCKNWLPYSLTWTALYKKNNRFFDSTQYWQNKQTNNQAMRTILSAELFSIICCLCNQIQQQCKVLIRLSRQLHDETPSNTHTHTEWTMYMYTYGSVPEEFRRKQRTLTRVHRLKNNAITHSLTSGTQEWGNGDWLGGYDTAKSRLQEKWNLAPRVSQLTNILCTQMLTRRTVFWCR